MKLAEEYRLSEYKDMGQLNDNEKVHIVRNRIDGRICVQKKVSVELYAIYTFLMENMNPYIPQIYECLQKENELVIIEEYIDGKNLEEMSQEHQFSAKEAVEITIELCRALYPLHNARPSIICRDLKAENVMITNEGKVKLIDFDIARRYQPGKVKDTMMMGTEGYAAPEQFGYGQTDARTDIYGLGVLLNYLLTHDFPTDQLADGDVGKIVKHCTEMRQGDRYQNVLELENALKKCRGDYVVQGTGNEPHIKSYDAYRIPGFRTGNIWKMILAVAGYIFITYFCLTLEFRDSSGELLNINIQRFERGIIWIMHIIFIFLVCDYRGVRRRIPILRQQNILIRAFGYIIAYVILIVVAALICTVIEPILF